MRSGIASGLWISPVSIRKNGEKGSLEDSTRQRILKERRRIDHATKTHMRACRENMDEILRRIRQNSFMNGDLSHSINGTVSVTPSEISDDKAASVTNISRMRPSYEELLVICKTLQTTFRQLLEEAKLTEASDTLWDAETRSSPHHHAEYVRKERTNEEHYLDQMELLFDPY